MNKRKLRKWKLNSNASKKIEKVYKTILAVGGGILAVGILITLIFGTIDILATNKGKPYTFGFMTEISVHLWYGIGIIGVLILLWWLFSNLEEIED